MRISELHVYPIKGAAGIPLRRARLDGFGIEADRRWMIVDQKGVFQTQREHAALAQLQVQLEPHALVVRSARAGEAHVPRTPADGKLLRVQVWDDEVDAIDCGDTAASVISNHLGMTVRLAYMPDTAVRPIDPDYDERGARVSFSDGFPLLLCTQESLDALNERLAQPIPILRFRPNVVVSGASAHAEDGWRRILLGQIECDVVKPCARCTTTTVDAATGLRGKEPLRTLAEYRSWNRKVWFGQNVIHRQAGELTVGDTVTVLEEAERRPPVAAPALLETR